MWGWRIKRILRSRLPERLAGKLPPAVVEVAIGAGMALLIFGLRLLLYPWIGETAPLAPVFVGIAAAVVLAGWRSALLTLALGEFLIWVFIMAPRGVLGPKDAVPVNTLIVATLAELLIIAIVGLYQHEVERAWSKRESQLGLLQQALKEIDHRTSNNYQTVLALVLAQAKTAKAAETKGALQQIADRIRAIASVSTKLAVASEDLDEIRVAEHLDELCKQIERGLSRSGVRLHCDFEDMVLGADKTVCISIIVNELVTNALKHAFPEGRAGTISITLARQRGAVELVVADDGVGMNKSAAPKGTGLGTRLVDTFVKQLRAKHEVTSDGGGTRHRIRFTP